MVLISTDFLKYQLNANINPTISLSSKKEGKYKYGLKDEMMWF